MSKLLSYDVKGLKLELAILNQRLQCEGKLKEYDAPWLENAKTVVRDSSGQFASKAGEIKNNVKEKAQLTSEAINKLVKDPAYRKKAGLQAGMAMAKVINSIISKNEKLDNLYGKNLDNWINDVAKTLGSPKDLIPPPKDADLKEKLEFQITKAKASYDQWKQDPENEEKAKFYEAALPAVGVALAVGLGFEVVLGGGILGAITGIDAILAGSVTSGLIDAKIQTGLKEDSPEWIKLSASFVSLMAGGAVSSGFKAVKSGIVLTQALSVADQTAKKMIADEMKRVGMQLPKTPPKIKISDSHIYKEELEQFNVFLEELHEMVLKGEKGNIDVVLDKIKSHSASLNIKRMQIFSKVRDPKLAKQMVEEMDQLGSQLGGEISQLALLLNFL